MELSEALRRRRMVRAFAPAPVAPDMVDGLLVPSNQAEYLPEIDNRAVREKVIRELMTREVIPAMQRECAGTALGVNLHWTLGSAISRT